MPEVLFTAPAPLRAVPPAEVFKALGHPTRQTLIHHLATRGTLCVKDFVPPTRTKPDNVGLHLGVLERAGLVEPVSVLSRQAQSGPG